MAARDWVRVDYAAPADFAPVMPAWMLDPGCAKVPIYDHSKSCDQRAVPGVFGVGRFDERRDWLYTESQYVTTPKTASSESERTTDSSDFEPTRESSSPQAPELENLASPQPLALPEVVAPPELSELRTVHLGIDLTGPVGTEIRFHDDGRVQSLGCCSEKQGYGHWLVSEHVRKPGFHPSAEEPEASDGKYWVLWGHLGADVLARWRVDKPCEKNAIIGRIGDIKENGGWQWPHVHIQVG